MELVSIIIVTYNSSDFIEETLESVLNQSYKNIEIIITDDGSKDNTIYKIEKFKNLKNLKNLKIITVDSNTGIPANCNRGIKEANSNYIKLIAGDDILEKDCIIQNMQFMKEHNSKIQFSDVHTFFDNGSKREYLKINKHPIIELNNNLTPKQQFYFLAHANYVIAPSVFFQKDLLDQIGYFNQTFTILEDYPMWINVTFKGEKIWFIDKKLVGYRKHNASITTNINKEFKKQYSKYIKEILLPILVNEKMYLHVLRKYRELELFKEKNSKLKLIIYKLLDIISIKYKVKSSLKKLKLAMRK